MNASPNTEKWSCSFRLFYYDRRGNYIRFVDFDWVPSRLDGACPVMSDVASYLRGLRDAGGQEGMPGKVTEWGGYMVVFSRHTKDRLGDSVVIPAREGK